MARLIGGSKQISKGLRILACVFSQSVLSRFLSSVCRNLEVHGNSKFENWREISVRSSLQDSDDAST